MGRHFSSYEVAKARWDMLDGFELIETRITDAYTSYIDKEIIIKELSTGKHYMLWYLEATNGGDSEYEDQEGIEVVKVAKTMSVWEEMNGS